MSGTTTQEETALDKKEILSLLAVAAAMIAIMKSVFYRQDFITTTRTAMSLFWMLTLPGYALLCYWKEKLGFMERIVVGTAAGAAVTAIASYYLGLLGLHVKYHGIALPVAMLIAAAVIAKIESKSGKRLAL